MESKMSEIFLNLATISQTQDPEIVSKIKPLRSWQDQKTRSWFFHHSLVGSKISENFVLSEMTEILTEV